MRSAVFAIALVVLMLAGTVAGKTGVALVANSPEARSVAELMTAEISAAPGIALVERENVGSLFKEIETALLSGGMRGISNKISMFGADVFAVLFTDEEVEGCSLTVFDAQSGIRLLDTALKSQDKGAQSKEAAEYVLQAIEKRKALMQGDLRTVSIVAFRNLDLPFGQAPFARAVSYLLEQLIVNAPGLTLLERRSLEWVNKERMLIPDSLSEKLKGGKVALEIEMARGSSASNCRATVLVKSGAGEVIGRIEVEHEAEDPLRMAKAIFSELSQTMDVSDSIASPDVERESDRLLWEYLYLRGHGNRHEALERMEASAALDPDHAFPYLASALLDAGTPRTAQGLEYGERVLDILRTVQKHNPELRMRRDIRAGIYGSPDDGYISPNYFHSLFREAPLRTDELREKRRALRSSIVRVASERMRARGLYGFDTLYLSDNGARPFRLALLLWIQECPGDIEAWFQDAVENMNDRHRSELGYMGLFLERVANEGLMTGEPPALDSVKRLWALYQDMDVESTLFTVPENRRSGLKLRDDYIPNSMHQKNRNSHSSLLSDQRYAEDLRSGIKKALEWLADRQRSDGSWTMPEHSPIGKTASTSLALLAFLASGEGCPSGMYWPVLEKGLRFLVERDLQKNGDFACVSAGDYPDNGLAALALIEAYLQIGDPALKEAAKLAVERIVKSQHQSGVIAGSVHITSKDYWVYMDDFCAMLTPLILAEKYGIEVDGLQNSIRKASVELLNAFEEESGLFYDVIWPEGWKNMQRSPKNDAQAKERLLESVYPVLTLHMLGLSNAAEVESAWKAVKDLRPDYYVDRKGIATSKSRYAKTQLMCAYGGHDWREWSSLLLKKIIENQQADGSWHPQSNAKQTSGGYHPAGAVYNTAYNILSLSVPAGNLAIHGSLPLIEIDPEKYVTKEERSEPWISKELLLEDRRIVFVESDAKDIFVGHMPLKNHASTPASFGSLSIDRISWKGFTRTGLQREITFDTFRGFNGNMLSKARARTVLSADYLFVGYSDGILTVPRNGDPIREIKMEDGLPVQSLTCLNGWIYAVVGYEDLGTKIVRIDIASDQVETLLQSGRLASEHPLETLASPPRFCGLVADPDRGRVLLLTGRWNSGSPRKEPEWSGLWEYAVDQGRWRRLIPLTRTGMARMHSYDDYLLVGVNGSAIGYDLANDQPEVLWAAGRLDSAEISRFDHSSALVNETEHVGMPYALVGDWFWGSGPFLRGNLKTGEIEKLPPLKKERHMIAGANPETGYLLVVTESGLWALKLKPVSQ